MKKAREEKTDKRTTRSTEKSYDNGNTKALLINY